MVYSSYCDNIALATLLISSYFRKLIYQIQIRYHQRFGNQLQGGFHVAQYWHGYHLPWAGVQRLHMCLVVWCIHYDHIKACILEWFLVWRDSNNTVTVMFTKLCFEKDELFLHHLGQWFQYFSTPVLIYSAQVINALVWSFIYKLPW